MGRYRETLCNLPISDWVQECIKLLALDLGAEDRAEVLHFLAMARYEEREPREALAACESALALPMSVEQRAMLLENKAASLLALGFVDLAAATVTELDSLRLDPQHRKSAETRAQALMMRAMCLAPKQPATAIHKMLQAGDAFEKCGQTLRASWARHSAARTAVALGNFDEALSILGGVDYPSWAADAELLRAEIAARVGDSDPLKNLTIQQEDLTPTQKGHLALIKALVVRSTTPGGLAQRSWLLDEATELLASDTKLDLLLWEAVYQLRAETFGRKESV